MKLRAKILGIEAGGPLVAVLNTKTLKSLGLIATDRVRGMAEKKYVVAIIDSSSTIAEDEIGIFDEVKNRLGISTGQPVTIIPEEKPASIASIKKKMAGKALAKDEIYEIVTDITDNRLAQTEIAFFVAAAYMREFSISETENLARAMAETGEMLRFDTKLVADKHCIGGVPGNRTTMTAVPIIAAAGITIPKTSSRAITDPAGTADVMEVLAPVSHSLDKIKEIIKKTGACIVWGGGVDIAPADDDIIKIEHPMQLDPTSMLLASVLAKKYAMGAAHVLIDIPFGPGTKCNRQRASDLEKKFLHIGKNLGMNIKTIKTFGGEPIGNGIGPALEARDVLYVLKNDKRTPQDLRKKAVLLSGIVLEMCGKARKGAGRQMAEKLLASGKAWHKMREIIKAQGGNPEIAPDKIPIGADTETIIAEKNGYVKAIDNDKIKKACRLLGCPNDKGAGMFLYKHVAGKVKEGDKLFTMYAESGRKLSEAIEFVDANKVFMIK